jgi:thiamine biosynthesis lipoprotein ApbE
MHHPSRVIAGVLGTLIWGGCLQAAAALDYEFYHENVLGTSLELRVQADSEEAARRAEGRVLGEIDRLARIFSGYDRTSEFSRWQETAQRPVPVSAELFEVLQACDHWREKSGGAFDPRVQALTQLWSKTAREDRSPTIEETAAARSLMSRPAWRLDPAARTAEHLSDCPLSLNAIAKGYIVDRACEAALEGARGIRGLLLNVGGDLRTCGDLSWAIGIASPRGDSETTDPFAHLAVRDRGVSTSGNYQRGFDMKQRHYSHIFDPRTGMPVDRTVSATVIADRAFDSDALATIFNVLPVEESLRLANALPGVACLLVGEDGRIARSDQWGRYEKSRPAVVALAADRAPAAPGTDAGKASKPASARGAWNNDLELLITMEIGGPEGNTRRYRRPYVAVWIEDKEGIPVRTLSLWVQAGGKGPRWIPDLRRWYKGDQVRRLVDEINLVQTISRATRPPGKYEVIWDGKDDRGQQLGAGEYTVSIEAAREHGTYQIIRKPVTLANEPFVEELKGNVEIKSASIAYRRKAPAR